jgi:hypothetical protein
MIVWRRGEGARGCSVVGCLPVLLVAVALSVLVYVLTDGHVFFFAF